MGALNLPHLISCNYVIMNNLPTSMWKTFLRVFQPCIVKIVCAVTYFSLHRQRLLSVHG